MSHAEWDQNLQFTSLSETTSIPVIFIWESSGSPGSLWPRGIQSNRARVKKKAREKKTNKQTNKSKLTLGWAPPLFCCELPIVWYCFLSMKKKRKNCNSNAKTYSATRAKQSYRKIFLVPFFFVFVRFFLFVRWSPAGWRKVHKNDPQHCSSVRTLIRNVPLTISPLRSKGVAYEPVDMVTSSAISSILLICWNSRFYNKQYLFVFCLSSLSEARLQMSLSLIPWLFPLEARSGLLIRFFDSQDVGHTSRYYMAIILEFNFGNFVDSRYIVDSIIGEDFLRQVEGTL